VKGPAYNSEHNRCKKEDTMVYLRSISSEERGIAAPPPPSQSPSPSIYLSTSINSTCNLDLITIGGILRLFDIFLMNLNTMFMIVDLIMCE
jgi:hypothetical protein